jgi:hypothetical protein
MRRFECLIFALGRAMEAMPAVRRLITAGR